MTVDDNSQQTQAVAAAWWRIGGRIQGVGFRPFVYRLACRWSLAGWVRNHSGSVEIFAQGRPTALAAFGRELEQHPPPLAAPCILASGTAAPRNLAGFVIRSSAAQVASEIHVPPDRSLCGDCLAELGDPNNRRHRYPFINCTQCGPRYSLITRLPYDRPNTTMRAFDLCRPCAAEYRDPRDRRFHAQPVACPDCGPRLSFVSSEGQPIAGNEEALRACVDALRDGLIVAVKGIGGYHLMCDARDGSVVARLRRRKRRPDKPLAVMFPADAGLSLVRACIELDTAQEHVLLGATRPIVLASKRQNQLLAPEIAPGLDEIGVLLPYSPLHQLLLADYGAPLVATSGNVSGEPVLTDDDAASRSLCDVADAFLHHDRPIRRPLDDSVYRAVGGAVRPLRLGRGHAPLELDLPFALPRPVLAVGGQMKNTVALAWGSRIVISQHIGDLECLRAREVFQSTLEDLQNLYGTRAEGVVCDAHPGYASRRWATDSGLPCLPVFHHHAHASVVAGENPEVRRWLVFTWDGTGYGENGALWGGEALLGRPGQWRRAATFRRFRVPGGDRAAVEPWRSALALCWEQNTEWTHCPADTSLLHEAWRRRINSPATSSVGRLFDAAAALLGLAAEASFDGQAPMQLEAAAEPVGDGPALPLRPTGAGLWISDWAPLTRMLTDSSIGLARRAGMFHDSLASALLSQALAVRTHHGECVVGLCGGVFQNRRLTGRAVELLTRHGFDVRLPRHVPINDGGLSYGQVIEAGAGLGFGS